MESNVKNWGYKAGTKLICVKNGKDSIKGESDYTIGKIYTIIKRGYFLLETNRSPEHKGYCTGFNDSFLFLPDCRVIRAMYGLGDE